MKDKNVVLKAVYQTYRACLAVQSLPVGKAIGGTDEKTRAMWDAFVCRLINMRTSVSPPLVHHELQCAFFKCGWRCGQKYNKSKREHPLLYSWDSTDMPLNMRATIFAITGVINAAR